MCDVHMYYTSVLYSLQKMQGYIGEMVQSSAAVHITKRNVRFISFKQQIHLPDSSSSSSFFSSPIQCTLQGNQVPGQNTSKIGSFKSVGSLCKLKDGGSLILPCDSQFIPRIASSTPIENILPSEYSSFLQSFPDEKKMCRNSLLVESSSSVQRQITLQEAVYDMTQCDLHDSDVHILFLPRKGILYLSNSMELHSILYWITGVLVVVLVACLSQSIVVLFNSTNHQNPRGEICLLSCVVSWFMTMLTTEVPGGMYFITDEEKIAYWMMIAYGGVRILVVIAEMLQSLNVGIIANMSTEKYHWIKTPLLQMENAIKDHNYYNFIIVCLILLSSRIHVTLETPYVLALLFLFGIRMFMKVFSISSMSQKTSSIAAAQQVVLLCDGIMLSVILQAGVAPQFARQADADACMLAFLFACTSIAHGIQRYNWYNKQFAENNAKQKKGM